MGNNIHDIEIQIVNYFRGELSDEERLEIDQWRQKSPENEKIFEEVMKGWEAIPLLNEMEQFNSFEALKKVNLKLDSYKQTNWLSYLRRIAAILILPLFLYTSYITFQNFSYKKLALSAEEIQTVTSRKGMVSHFSLSDGTKVWLNSGSTLQYPLCFTRKKREVKLTGEAYFEVAENKQKAFLLKAHQLNIEVLGTSFNVINYDDEPSSEVILSSGKVKLYSETNKRKKEIVYMHPGQKVSYNKKNKTIRSKEVDVDKYSAWRNGNLIFRDDSMSEVIKRLGRWFDVEIIVQDPDINDYIYTATFTNENLQQVLDLLRFSAPIDYRIEDRKILKNGKHTKQKVILMKKK